MAILTWSTVLTWSAVLTVLTVSTVCSDLLAILVKKPVSVESPIVISIRILLDSDDRGHTVLTRSTILAISTILAVFTMIDGDRIAIHKADGITDNLSVVCNRRNIGYVIILLQGIHQSLQSSDVGVHFLAQLLECGHTLVQRVDIFPNISRVELLTSAQNGTECTDQNNKSLHISVSLYAKLEFKT